MSNQYKKLDLSTLAKLVKKKKNTLIICHQNPDPDTLGSAFALKELLNYLGSPARVACPDTPSKKFDFITGKESSCLKKESLFFDIFHWVRRQALNTSRVTVTRSIWRVAGS